MKIVRCCSIDSITVMRIEGEIGGGGVQFLYLVYGVLMDIPFVLLSIL